MIVIARSGTIFWNDKAVSLETLAGVLASTASMKPEPELHFRPDPTAEFDVVSKVLAEIKKSGIGKFGFVGNAAY